MNDLIELSIWLKELDDLRREIGRDGLSVKTIERMNELLKEAEAIHDRSNPSH